jgi:hypothetical protein
MHVRDPGREGGEGIWDGKTIDGVRKEKPEAASLGFALP